METTEIIAELRKVLAVGDNPVFCGGTFIPKQLAMEAADRLESLDKRWKITRVERDQAREMRERAERLLGEAQFELMKLRKVQKNDDLISREELEKALFMLGRMYIDGMTDDKAYLQEQRVYEVLRNARAVEAEPVVHAHWDNEDCCTACGEEAIYYWERSQYIYTKRCPHCGAHMDEEVSE